MTRNGIAEAAFDLMDPSIPQWQKALVLAEVGSGFELDGRKGKRVQKLLDKAGKHFDDTVEALTLFAKKKSKRLKHLGRTPSKKSKTGREVRKRMREEGKLKKEKMEMIYFL